MRGLFSDVLVVTGVSAALAALGSPAAGRVESRLRAVPSTRRHLPCAAR